MSVLWPARLSSEPCIRYAAKPMLYLQVIAANLAWFGVARHESLRARRTYVYGAPVMMHEGCLCQVRGIGAVEPGIDGKTENGGLTRTRRT